DFDAVGFAGGTRLDVAEKNDFVGSFSYGDVDILHAGEEIGEFGEFVIVRGEKGAGARVFLEVLDDGPSDGKAVEGGGAAADFVEEDEASRSGVSEDACDFGHFDEKSGTTAGEVVAGADAGKDAVGNRKLCLARGNEAADLCHEND